MRYLEILNINCIIRGPMHEDSCKNGPSFPWLPAPPLLWPGGAGALPMLCACAHKLTLRPCWVNLHSHSGLAGGCHEGMVNLHFTLINVD